MNLMKDYFSYVEDPVPALKNFLAARSFGQACLGYFAAALAWVLFFNIGSGISCLALLVKLLILFAAEITAGYLIAAVCGLFLDFSRVKEASAAELFCLVGSAGFIKGLLIAFALFSAMWPQLQLDLLAPLVLLGVFALQLGYLTRALMRAYGLSAAKALWAWLFGLLPFGPAAALGGVFFVWSMMLLF